MMAVDGVKVAEVSLVEATYAAYPPLTILNWYTPDAGYLALDNVHFVAECKLPGLYRMKSGAGII